MQHGRNLAKRAVIIHRGVPSDTTQEIEEIQKTNKVPKHSAPDLEARKGLSIIMGDSFCRINATPWTNLFVLRDALSLKHSG